MDYKNINPKPPNLKNAVQNTEKKAIVAEGEVAKDNRNVVVKGASAFGDTLLTTVLKPAIQRTCMELVRATCQEFTKAVEKQIFGREVFGDSLFSTAPLGYGIRRPAQRNYSKISRDPYAEPSQGYRVVSQSARNVKDIAFTSYEAAKRVLEEMKGDLSDYSMISVGDYYAYCGESQDYTDFKYGWTNLNGVEIVPDRHGNYTISLPVPKVLGR